MLHILASSKPDLSSATSEICMSYCVPRVIAQVTTLARCKTMSLWQFLDPVVHTTIGETMAPDTVAISFHIFPGHVPVTKRTRTIALPALPLTSLCMLLGQDYITHYSLLSPSREGYEIYAVLNTETSRPTLKVLPLPAT
jgi:hypothetical protein